MSGASTQDSAGAALPHRPGTPGAGCIRKVGDDQTDPHIEGAHFDMGYYTGTHQKLVRERLGDSCKGLTIERGLSGGALGTPPAYTVMTHMQFDSMSSLRNIMVRHAPELMADIPNFTTIRPVLQISEVVVGA